MTKHEDSDSDISIAFNTEDSDHNDSTDSQSESSEDSESENGLLIGVESDSDDEHEKIISDKFVDSSDDEEEPKLKGFNLNSLIKDNKSSPVKLPVSSTVLNIDPILITPLPPQSKPDVDKVIDKLSILQSSN